MIDRAVSAPGRRPMRLGAPLATAAAVLAIGGGTAFALAGGGGHHGTTPAGSAPSHPVAYTTPSNAVPANGALPADLQHRIEQCIQSEGEDAWTSNSCGEVESICETAQALGDSPCTLIPKAVVCSSPSYAIVVPGDPVAEIPADKAQLCGIPNADVPTKSVAPTH
jgi:hypothetical protein